MNSGSDTMIAKQAADGRRQVEGRSIRWSEALAEQAVKSGVWANKTLADALTETLRSDPHRVVLVDNGQEITVQALAHDADRLARALAQRLTRGSAVSFMLPNWYEAAVLYLACTLSGMVANPILPSLRERELRFILQDVKSRMIVLPDQWRGHDYATMIDNAISDLAEPPLVVIVRGAAKAPHVDYQTLLCSGHRSPLPALNPNALQMILYTSGTTGRPKGVMHTHNSLNALTKQIGEHWKVNKGDTFLVPSPISHIGGSLYAFEAPVLLGTTAVLMEKWLPDEAIALAVKYRCTHMAGATPFLTQMLSAAQTADEHLPALKVFICGGASVPPSLVRQASAWFTRTAISRVYGSTEVPVTTVGALEKGELDLAADTDGRPGYAEVRISDSGEVLARGPQMMAGYIHPEDEDAAFDGDGFYRTGDLGRIGTDGCLVITGRAKDLIIRKGENIAPKEVEDALVEHPSILEAAVVGLPDPSSGEKAYAVLVMRESTTTSVAELAAFLKRLGLASFKWPEMIVQWPNLPKNDAGKVLKHEIRARLSNTLTEGR